MPYSSDPLRRAVESKRSRICPPDQVANGLDKDVNLTPVSQAPADAIKAAWSTWLPGQPVPLLWERVPDDQPCFDE